MAEFRLRFGEGLGIFILFGILGFVIIGMGVSETDFIVVLTGVLILINALIVLKFKELFK